MATRQMGTTIIVSTSLALKLVPPISKLASKGGASRVLNDWSPKARGRKRPAPASSWARPIVATVSNCRRREEPADDEGLHQHAQHQRRRQAGDQADPEVPVPGHHQHHGEGGRHASRSPWAKLMIRWPGR